MEDDDEVEDDDKDDNFKDITARGLYRDLGFREDIKGTKGIDLLMMMMMRRRTTRWRKTTRTTTTSRISQLWD